MAAKSPLLITLPEMWEHFGWAPHLPNEVGEVRLHCGTLIEAFKEESGAQYFLSGPHRKARRRAAQSWPWAAFRLCLRVACSSGELLIEICGMKWATAVCLDKYILCYMP